YNRRRSAPAHAYLEPLQPRPGAAPQYLCPSLSGVRDTRHMRTENRKPTPISRVQPAIPPHSQATPSHEELFLRPDRGVEPLSSRSLSRHDTRQASICSHCLLAHRSVQTHVLPHLDAVKLRRYRYLLQGSRAFQTEPEAVIRPSEGALHRRLC